MNTCVLACTPTGKVASCQQRLQRCPVFAFYFRPSIFARTALLSAGRRHAEDWSWDHPQTTHPPPRGGHLTIVIWV